MARSLRFSRLAVWLAGLFGLLTVLPLVSVFVLSISARIELIPTEFTVRWYGFELDTVASSAGVSLMIAGPAIVLALAISLPAALALVRGEFRGKMLMDQVIVFPLVIPATAFGLTLLQLFKTESLSRVHPLMVLILAHTAVVIPVMARTLIASLHRVDPSIEEAAQTLGATPLRTFRDVTVPMIAPAIVVGTVLGFARSVNDFVMTFFLISPDYIPLSIQVFRSTLIGVPQLTSAVSVILLVLSIGAIIFAERAIEVEFYG